MIPYYSLNLILVPTDNCSGHPSPKKRFTANGDHHRKPQLDTMQREGNVGIHPSDTYNHSSRICGSWDIKEEGVVRWQEPEHQEAHSEAVSSRNGCIHTQVGHSNLQVIGNSETTRWASGLMGRGLYPCVTGCANILPKGVCY